MYYASLCAIARDEDPDIREWVAYHLGIGFEHLYLYDNASRTSLAGLLHDFVARKLVTVINFPLSTNQQLSAYADALHRFGATTVWLGFLDIDEFLVPKAQPDVRDLLDGYRAYGGLGIHWKVFGSNGHRRRPEGGILRNYTQVLRDDPHIKSIIQPEKVVAPRSPHHFLYRDGAFCVNEDAVPVLTHHSYHVSRTAQINHYYYKSFEDFLRKMERGLATPARDGRNVREESELEAFSRQTRAQGYRDEAVLRLLERHDRSGSTPEALAAGNRDWATDFQTFAERIARSMRTNKPDEALRQLNVCLRYHDAPEAWMIAAKLHLVAGTARTALNFIRKLLVDLDSPYREQAFACLADYYDHTGRNDTAQNLRAVLRKNGTQA